MPAGFCTARGSGASNRLTGISDFQRATDGNVNLAGYTWDYDAASRIWHLTSQSGQVTYAYDWTYSYTYDAEGNRTSRTNLASGEYDVYQWDNRNRLTAVVHFAADSSQVWTVVYQYDYANPDDFAVPNDRRPESMSNYPADL